MIFTSRRLQSRLRQHKSLHLLRVLLMSVKYQDNYKAYTGCMTEILSFPYGWGKSLMMVLLYIERETDRQRQMLRYIYREREMLIYV